MIVRKGSAKDDHVVVRHYLALWDSYGTSPDEYDLEARSSIEAFLRAGRDNWGLMTFIAEAGGNPVGSAGCQIQISNYPQVLKREFRYIGYIWHVFVEPRFQSQSLGKALTRAAIEHLRDIGCTHVALNSSEAGRRLYASAGFVQSNEMRLKI